MPPHNAPANNLSDVKKLIEQGKVRFEGRALQDAWSDFQWGPHDILDAIKQLEPMDCYRSQANSVKPKCIYDYYRRRNVNFEDIYTHFYIQEGYLVIDSFHQLGM